VCLFTQYAPIPLKMIVHEIRFIHRNNPNGVFNELERLKRRLFERSITMEYYSYYIQPAVIHWTRFYAENYTAHVYIALAI